MDEKQSHSTDFRIDFVCHQVHLELSKHPLEFTRITARFRIKDFQLKSQQQQQLSHTFFLQLFIESINIFNTMSHAHLNTMRNHSVCMNTREQFEIEIP